MADEIRRVEVPSPEYEVWKARVLEVVDQAHGENWGGRHHSGFCEACADALTVAQYAVPNGPGEPPSRVGGEERTCGGTGGRRGIVGYEISHDPTVLDQNVLCPGCSDCKPWCFNCGGVGESPDSPGEPCIGCSPGMSGATVTEAAVTCPHCKRSYGAILCNGSVGTHDRHADLVCLDPRAVALLRRWMQEGEDFGFGSMDLEADTEAWLSGVPPSELGACKGKAEG